MMGEKFAVTVFGPDIITVVVAELLFATPVPLQELKLYPELGVAVIVLLVPCGNVPPPLTVPPCPASKFKVWF
tara:strand:+ start:285 stop:503 length:219 start_codon:yes stop_codon:yes gene_type:complete